MKNLPIQPLLKIFFDSGVEVRYVGGCVRDYLLNLQVVDYDLAANTIPENIIEILNRHNIKNIPTGIKHGTITAVYLGYLCQITSLRKDLITDGRHAKVAFIKDWGCDASRRDFTINAIYCDMNGNFFDPLNGIEDLKNGTVKFIGEPTQRIEEDYLRILRFFRFFAHFGNQKINQKDLEACFYYKDKIQNLSKERIGQEFKKLLLGRNKLESIKIMKELQILDVIFQKSVNIEGFVRYCEFKELQSSTLLSLATLALNALSPQELQAQLALSNVEKKYLQKFVKY